MNGFSDRRFAAASPQAASEGLADGFASQVKNWAEGAVCPADMDCLARIARELALAACDGHVCLPLDALSNVSVADAKRILLESGMAAEMGASCRALPATAFPLVIDQGRLYLRAFFDLESSLFRALTTLAVPLPVDAAALDAARATLGTAFPPREGVDWQKAAAALALTRRLTIISGGPGTGKTTTVAALIGCLLELEPELRIGLAAPTGKAAARLREALGERTRHLRESVRVRLPAEAYTLHRLLGASATPGRFRHHAGNPLALDLVVVDEASMLDLALAARLFDALPPQARLVLLGDKDQLSAVEAGAVFGELSSGWRFGADESARLAKLADAPEKVLLQGAGSEAALPDSVVWLQESYRFRDDSGIGRLARNINAGDGAAALGWMRAHADPEVEWIEDETGSSSSDAPLSAAVLAAMEKGYAAYFSAFRDIRADEPTDARFNRLFDAFGRFRVLVAVHQGRHGLMAVNAHLEQHARTEVGSGAASGAFWAGRPVIVLKNDPVTRLFNGDIGLCLPWQDGALMAVFPASGGGVRAIPPHRLPEHDTAFALTVHKSQGSEFSEVLLLLPSQTVRVLSRELLYTGVTRAARRVSIAGSAAVFEAGCATRSVRFSGLGEKLRNRNGGSG
ncbi:MAG: exodeoxyribonuclease V subunit alpha [Azoarcus sp.]|jgi:exodeoxyribonuclease V alpha subunit|nr:exodeoxyribonuclease V subunit alpha [Azoarcus sp.]